MSAESFGCTVHDCWLAFTEWSLLHRQRRQALSRHTELSSSERSYQYEQCLHHILQKQPYHMTHILTAGWHFQLPPGWR